MKAVFLFNVLTLYFVRDSGPGFGTGMLAGGLLGYGLGAFRGENTKYVFSVVGPLSGE